MWGNHCQEFSITFESFRRGTDILAVWLDRVKARAWNHPEEGRFL